MAAPSPDDQAPGADVLEAQRQANCARKWIAELGVSEKFQRKWLERAKKINKRYLKEDSVTEVNRRFAMLWSNTQTIQPAVYSRPPTAVVTRRFNDQDPVARSASEILERCLTASIDLQNLDSVLRQASFDFVRIARGQTWERYVPTYGPQVTPEIALQPVTGADETDDDADPSYQDEDGNPYEGDVLTRDDGSPYGLGTPYRPVIYEQSITDYVNWDDFGQSPARTWDEVSYVWRRVYLSRDQLVDRFGENLGKLIPLDWGPIEQGRGDSEARLQKKAAIYEIWDKGSKKVYWISKSWNSRPLDERDDPLGLDGFFPCPKPLLGTTANDTVMPVPDYVYYQDQAEEIDKLTARIAELQDALKVRGFYAGDGKSNLNNLLNAPNNMLIPVPAWQSLKENGGAKGMVEWWPIDIVVAALNACIQQRQQLINDVFQITGVADILRGSNDPSATATAEGIKAQWGTLRIRDRQIEMMRFARDILRIKGEVIAAKFSAETLKAMSGVSLPTNADKQQAMAAFQQQQMMAQLQAQQQAAAQAQMAPQGPPGAPQPGGPPQAAPQQPMPPQPMPAAAPPAPMQPPPELQKLLQTPSWEDIEALLQNDAARTFRIDIETDSTIEADEQQEKAGYVQFIQALGQMVQQWGPAVETQPALAPMVAAIIKTGVRKFRAGRELEEVVDQAMDAVAQAAAQPKGVPGAGPQQPPVDQTKIAVATIQAQSDAASEQAATQREEMKVQIAQQKLALQGQEAQAKIYALSRDPNPQALA